MGAQRKELETLRKLELEKTARKSEIDKIRKEQEKLTAAKKSDQEKSAKKSDFEKVSEKNKFGNLSTESKDDTPIVDLLTQKSSAGGVVTPGNHWKKKFVHSNQEKNISPDKG